MATPTTKFRVIPNTLAVGCVDTAAERIADFNGDSDITTGSSSAADFGTVDISSGAAKSSVLTMMWQVANGIGGNTSVDTFKLWLSSNGFDQAATDIQYIQLSGADQGAPSNTENYSANANTTTYSFTVMPESEPGSQNVYPTDEGSSMALAGTQSDDVIMWALYADVAASETTGTYTGTATAGKELRFSFKFSFS